MGQKQGQQDTEEADDEGPVDVAAQEEGIAVPLFLELDPLLAYPGVVGHAAVMASGDETERAQGTAQLGTGKSGAPITALRVPHARLRLLHHLLLGGSVPGMADVPGDGARDETTDDEDEAGGEAQALEVVEQLPAQDDAQHHTTSRRRKPWTASSSSRTLARARRARSTAAWGTTSDKVAR